VKKQVLIGAESFEEIIEGDYFYIDKTLFIKELFDNKGKVTLITRPRRFGKTLNMSMLRSFFDVQRDSRSLFEGLAITKYSDIIKKHQNNYPVISLTLKNLDFNSYEKTILGIKNLIADLYRLNLYLCDGDKMNEFTVNDYKRYCSKEVDETDLTSALRFLTECFHTYHDKRVIILLDEYDTPIDSAERHGYYNEMIEFMRGFLGNVFKTNDFLEFGVLTGVQRISKEGLFSSFNNPKVCGVLDNEFATSFGFTDEEVKATCETYDLSDKYIDVKNWYDGYRIGRHDMYNPWSITMYLQRQTIENYWVNTGLVQVLRDVFHKGDDRLRNDLAGLLTGSPITMALSDHTTYPIEYVSSNTFWTLLLRAGYLKPSNGAKENWFEAELVNMEVKDTFTHYATEWLNEERLFVSDSIRRFIECLLSGDYEEVKRTLNEDILNNPSSFDLSQENSYHMFIYGMLLALSGRYTVNSNQESGKGRSDCMIKPADKNAAAIVLEFKHIKDETQDLKAEAARGLEQINEKAYIQNLKLEGYTHILKYSIAFHKKTCEVLMEANM